MNTKVVKQIGMREFLRNTKKIKTAVANGEEFEVLDHTTPAFRIVPAVATEQKKYTFADLKKFQFTSKERHLAENTDNHLYGA